MKTLLQMEMYYVREYTPTCRFALLSFFFWPLCCLFFDIRILITTLVSSNSSYAITKTGVIYSRLFKYTQQHTMFYREHPWVLHLQQALECDSCGN